MDIRCILGKHYAVPYYGGSKEVIELEDCGAICERCGKILDHAL